MKGTFFMIAINQELRRLSHSHRNDDLSVSGDMEYSNADINKTANIIILIHYFFLLYRYIFFSPDHKMLENIAS